MWAVVVNAQSHLRGGVGYGGKGKRWPLGNSISIPRKTHLQALESIRGEGREGLAGPHLKDAVNGSALLREKSLWKAALNHPKENPDTLSKGGEETGSGAWGDVVLVERRGTV